MIPKITRRSFAIGVSAMAVTAATSKLPAMAAVSSNAKTAYAYFKKRGYKDFQAAGIVGNLMWESGVNPKRHQDGGGPGRGIAQWETHSDGKGRWDDLVRYANSKRRNPTSLNLQLSFVIYELNVHNWAGKKELKASRNVDDAATVFCKYFERPREGFEHFDERIANAKQVLGGGGGGGGPQPPSAFPTLRQGSRGSAVRSLQYLLTAHGYSLSADGDFGPSTDSKVRAFQTNKNLKVDGVVGSVTWDRVIITLRQGASGSAVKALQAELNDSGSRLTVDGSFGPATNSAVVRYQTSHNLSVDGVVGGQTWGSLIN